MEKNFLFNAFNPQMLSDKKKESLFTAIFIGGVLIIIALIYIIHLSDNLWDSLINFFSSLTLAQVPATGISLPAPANPAEHVNLFNAASQFTMSMGVLEIVLLMLRIKLNSPVSRIAETIENIVFLLGTSYLTITYLANMRFTSEWFVFWAGIILIFGLALMVRGFVLLAKR